MSKKHRMKWIKQKKFKKGMREILKIQKPLAGDPMCMAYNKDNSITFMAPYDEGAEKWFGDRLKVYAWFKYSDGNNWELIEESDDQEPEW